MEDTLTVPIDGVEVPVAAAGPDDGELVVLLHGFPQTPAAWYAVLPTLAAAGYRVVAPWQRGYVSGWRARPEDVRLERLGADVLALADELGAGRFHVVGHDWGALVGWSLAATSERVASLAALSVPHPGAMVAALPAGQALRSAYVAFFRLPVMPERTLGAGNGRVLRTLLERSGLPAALAREYAEHLAGAGLLGGALNWYRANGLAALRAIPPVTVPTLFLWGSGDRFIGRRAADDCGRFVEASFHCEVLDEGHWIPERQPGMVATAVLRHLERAGAARD